MNPNIALAVILVPVVGTFAHVIGLSPLSLPAWLWSLAVWLFLYAFIGPYRRYAFRSARGSSCPWRDANRCEDTGGYDA